MARTQFQMARNWSIKKAHELIKAAPEASGKKIEIVWKITDSKNRHVTADDVAVFVQTFEDAQGTFIAPFSALVLPP